ncbi:MAG: fluoride efflux transporter CrcB [Methylococcales bacterium]|nr:fluoride efflux transporter CrcB [Methylococcales bacterium]
MLTQLIAVAVFGMLGAVSRFSAGYWVTSMYGHDFPYGTLTVNVVGSFLVGVAYVFLVEKAMLDLVWRVGFIIGFLGAFTTFSTFSLDTIRLLEHDQFARAGVNVLTNVSVCLLVTWAAIRVARL